MMTVIPDSLDGWNYDIITQLIDNKVVENEILDFKLDLPDANTLTDLCCSFANSKGGFIILGVGETRSSFRIEGVKNDREIAHKFGQTIRAEPHIRFEIPKLIEIPNSPNVLVIFYIPSSPMKPHAPQDEQRRIFWREPIRVKNTCL